MGLLRVLLLQIATMRIGDQSIAISVPSAKPVWDVWNGQKWLWYGPTSTDEWFAAWASQIWPENYQIQHYTVANPGAPNSEILRVASTEPIFHCTDKNGAQLWLNHVEQRDLSSDNPVPCVPDGMTSNRWKTCYDVARPMP